MKGIKINVRTRKIEEFDDGLPLQSYSPASEHVGVDLADIKKLIEYAKKQKLI